MSEAADETSRHVASTANRLRMVQVDFADASDQVRKECLSEEIERALEKIVPQERKAFLEELMGRFPTWDAKVEVALRKEEAPDRSLTDQRELQDPNFLVARLVDIAGSLAPKEREVLVERLREAGLAAVGKHAWPEETARTVRAKLQFGEKDRMDAARALELISMLVEFTCSLDQLVWPTWRKMSPRSSISGSGGLRSTIVRFLRGDQDVPRGQVTQDLAKLRKLTAAVVSAVSQAGRQFASRHLGRFSPTEISALVSMERGGLLVSREVKCWRKYVELAEALNEATIEKEILDAIANYAESLMRGIRG